MFTATFKKCNCANYVVTKTFDSGSASVSFNFKEEQSVLNPVIVVGTTENLTQYNYVEIPSLGRKYFVTDIIVLRENMYQISLHVDVLGTYDLQIRNVKADIKRQENKFNMYLDDSEFHIYNNEFIQVKSFTNSMFDKTFEYVLVTAGG